MVYSSVSHYEIIARAVDRDEKITVETSTNITNFNVTGLLPGMAYELAEVAVSKGGNITAKSPESDSIIILLGFTKQSTV